MIYDLLDLYDVKSGMGNKSRNDFDPNKYENHILMFKEIFNNSKLPDKNKLSTTVNLKQGELERFDVKFGDVLLTSSSETPNELAMSSVALRDYPNTVYSGFSKRLRPITHLTNPQYMRYWFRSRQFRDYIDSTVSMTTRANLNMAILSAIKIDLPDLNTQKAIANILSSLDDKIELNNKINKNLEELAQTLYKHWFVDFEFPNEEDLPYKSSGGKMVESELGLIPEGWIIEPLGNSKISKLITSGINKFKNEKIYLATADVTNTTITNRNTTITMEDKPSRANMQPRENTLWFAKMKNSRKLIRVSRNSTELINDYIFSTGFAGLYVENYLNFVWTFLLTPSFNEIKDTLASGTTQEAINNRNINKINLLIPKEKTLNKFEKILNSVYGKIEQNDNENRRLEKLRDLLLPKLMSGEIRVPIKE